jgi:hypothetical protein
MRALTLSLRRKLPGWFTQVIPFALLRGTATAAFLFAMIPEVEAIERRELTPPRAVTTVSA